ncbi:MAG: HyaD/HybD family hydrogenase maturation endopeptidase [Bryobacteraceae bacterium]
MECKTLVAGVGNILLGDEGLGVHAVRRLLEEGLPAGTDAVDAGTALGDLLAELGRYDRLILVDAVRGGGRAGDLYRLEVRSSGDLRRALSPLSLHEFGVADALEQARALGALPPRVVLLGMEPERIEPGIGLSPHVAAALPGLVRLIREEAGLTGPHGLR